jgi:hypothetical protein
MDENLTKVVSLTLGSHGFQLGIEGLHLFLALLHHVVGEFFAAVLISDWLKAVRSSLDSWLEWLRHVVSSVDVCELDLILLIICIVVEATVHDWLGAKHDWDEDNNNYQESHTNSVLLIIGLSNDWLKIISSCFVPLSKAKDLGDHDVDDGRSILIVHVTLKCEDIVVSTILQCIIISLIVLSVL